LIHSTINTLGNNAGNFEGVFDTHMAIKKTMNNVRIKIPKPMLEAIDMAISNQLREITVTGEMKKRKFEK